MVESLFFTTKMDVVDHEQSSPISLLSGPPSCGKTSLLFQFAFNVASRSDQYVVFICNRNRMEKKPPFLSQGIDPSSDVFQRIKMKYVDGDEGIQKYFAAFHLHTTFPAAVVLDDFGDFFDVRCCQERYESARGRDMAIVRTLALCHNAMTHENERGFCKLLMSDTHQGDMPRLLFIYKRWISAIYTIKGDGSGSYQLKCNDYLAGGSSGGGRTRIAKYSIALQYLLLEQINDDGERN